MNNLDYSQSSLSERQKVYQEVDQASGLAKPVIRVKFGTAGIRGVYGQEVSIKETISVCRAVNRLLGEGKFGRRV